MKEKEGNAKAVEHLKTIRKQLDQGNYVQFLKENHKALLMYGSIPPADEALYNLGLIYAHPEYAGKDSNKSIDYFKKLANEFPDSPLAVQSKIWIGILQENEKLKRENEKLNTTIKESQLIDIEIDEKKKELSK